jgi:hypothetical protein
MLNLGGLKLDLADFTFKEVKGIAFHLWANQGVRGGLGKLPKFVKFW